MLVKALLFNQHTVLTDDLRWVTKRSGKLLRKYTLPSIYSPIPRPLTRIHASICHLHMPPSRFGGVKQLTQQKYHIQQQYTSSSWTSIGLGCEGDRPRRWGHGGGHEGRGWVTTAESRRLIIIFVGYVFLCRWMATRWTVLLCYEIVRNVQYYV